MENRAEIFSDGAPEPYLEHDDRVAANDLQHLDQRCAMFSGIDNYVHTCRCELSRHRPFLRRPRRGQCSGKPVGSGCQSRWST